MCFCIETPKFPSKDSHCFDVWAAHWVWLAISFSDGPRKSAKLNLTRTWPERTQITPSTYNSWFTVLFILFFTCLMFTCCANHFCLHPNYKLKLTPNLSSHWLWTHNDSDLELTQKSNWLKTPIVEGSKLDTVAVRQIQLNHNPNISQTKQKKKKSNPDAACPQSKHNMNPK